MSKDGAKTPDEIRAEIAERQQRLAGTVDELTNRANPKTLVNQGRDDAVALMRDAVLDEQGGPRVERLAMAGAAVIVLVTALVLLKRRNRD